MWDDDEDKAHEADLAEDDLDRILRLKEELTGLLDGMKAHLEAMPKVGLRKDWPDWEYAAAVIEGEFDDLFARHWFRLTDISRSVAYTATLPTCEALRSKKRLPNRHMSGFSNRQAAEEIAKDTSV